jgi:hypothetical protein
VTPYAIRDVQSGNGYLFTATAVSPEHIESGFSNATLATILKQWASILEA